MMNKEWYDTFEEIQRYVFQIKTEYGKGTGFVFSIGKNKEDRSINTLMIATAAHVVNNIKKNEKIEVTNPYKKLSFDSINQNIEWNQLGGDELDIGILTVSGFDSSIFTEEDVPLTIPKEQRLAPGCEVGWVGFPHFIDDIKPCFFHGYISTFFSDTPSYLIDGVAINGVSGGPVFQKSGEIIGIVSGYRPNNYNQKLLPGLSVMVPINALKNWMSSELSMISIYSNLGQNIS